VGNYGEPRHHESIRLRADAHEWLQRRKVEAQLRKSHLVNMALEVGIHHLEGWDGREKLTKHYQRELAYRLGVSKTRAGGEG
jgi:hypothetical protein